VKYDPKKIHIVNREEDVFNEVDVNPNPGRYKRDTKAFNANLVAGFLQLLNGNRRL